MSKVRLEWGSTAVLKFITERFNESTQEYERVDADEFYAQLETAEIEPQKIADLPAEKHNTGEYYVAFYADPNTIDSGKAYYVAFYWSYKGTKQAERYLVVVVPDV